MSELLTRREFVRKSWQLTKRAAAVAVIWRLKADTAYAEQSVDCPIYMLHETTPRLVENIIVSNINRGKIPVDIRSLAAIIRGEAPQPEDPLFALTFDDGLLSQYTQALPVLERWQVPATFFVIGTSWEDGVHRYMNPQQKQELASKGYEIGSHTLNHPPNIIALRRNNLGAYQAEVAGSRREISQLIQKEVVSFSSPISVYDSTLVADIIGSGYEAAVSTASNQRSIPTVRGLDKVYNLMRQRIS